MVLLLAILMQNGAADSFAADSGAAENAAIGLRPNVVVLLADDCTKSDLGCYGGQAQTPHLSRLAAEGLTFDRCYQAAPMCSPTRHCLYTGVYPVRSGAYPNHTFVRDGIGSIAQDLQAAGYRTALTGKRHVAPPSELPFEYSGTTGRIDWAAVDSLLGETAGGGPPFWLAVCSSSPHTPWDRGDANSYPPESLRLPPTWVDTPETREAYSRYLAEVGDFDRQVGRLLDRLDRYELADDTIVIALSEQGSSFPFAKWTCSEAGVGSGMIIRWPGHVAPGSRTRALVEYVDVVPTILDATKTETSRSLDGRSFLPVLLGDARTHKRFVFSEQTSRGINEGPRWYGMRSVRDERWRLVHNLTAEIPYRTALDTSGWFASWVRAAATDPEAAAIVARHRHRREWELYDAEADPHCQVNRIDDASLASEIAALKSELAAWMQSQGDKGQETEKRALDRMRRGSQRPNQKPKARPRSGPSIR